MRVNRVIGVAAIAFSAAACSGGPSPTQAPGTAPATTVVSRPTTSGVSTTSTAPLTMPPDSVSPPPSSWLAGSVTCAELEGAVPIGVDDSSADLATGIVWFSWGDGESATIQVLDDPTCKVESDAWRFLLRQNIDADLLYRTGVLCDAVEALESASPPPANLETVLTALDRSRELCS